MIELNGGIRFGTSVVLDATRVQPESIVSHAHSDHLRRHKTIYATAPTLEFARLSMGEFNGVPLEYGRSYHFGECLVRPEPAGHMLGSAQFVIDYAGYRIVYTGDFKLGDNVTCPPAKINECDILFLDTTFGKKDFEFPDYAYLKQRLLEFVESSIYGGFIPVIFAYNLGKAQEVAKILDDGGFRSYATPQACAFARVCRKFDMIVESENVLETHYPEGGAVILPPFFRSMDDLFPGYPRRSCFVSGWALYQRVLRSFRADEYLPLSDHASYSDMVQYVETARPSKVYCLFGFQEIVDDLRVKGFNAVRASLANRKGIDRYLSPDFDFSGR